MTDQRTLDGHPLHPETLALGLGFDPKLSEGSVKPPVFLTSTFQFSSAEEGKRFFELAYHLRAKKPNESTGLIYSRINNPNLQIFEERIAAWDKMEKAAVFASGMAAITSTILALVRPGDHILSSAPVYGGTHYFFEHILPEFGIHVTQIPGGDHTPDAMRKAAQKLGPGKVRMIYLETPANPSNVLVDIDASAKLAKELSTPDRKVILAVDNTLLGPVFQCPAVHGADLVLYSATKFIGGHSDLIAGVVTGNAELMDGIYGYRTILGTMANPFSGWMLLRSLETLSIRMHRQAKSAAKIAALLQDHPRIRKVYYPGLLEPGTPQHDIYTRQCSGPGSLLSFEIDGGEAEAFKMLNAVKVCRLAVSLGGTESLIEHPMSMTHADVPKDLLNTFGVNESMIRLSVGIEHLTDLKRDLMQALDKAFA